MSLKKLSLPPGWKRISKVTYFGGLIILLALASYEGAWKIDQVECTLGIFTAAIIFPPLLYWASLVVACYVLEGFKGRGNVKTEGLFGQWFNKNPKHITIILLPLILLIIGIVFNSNWAAILLAGFAASMVDPFALGTGIILGLFFFRDYRKFLGITILGGTAYAVLITFVLVAIEQGSRPNFSLSDVPYYHYLSNFAVVFWVAHIVNFIRIFREEKAKA